MPKDKINGKDIISKMNINHYNQPPNKGALPMIAGILLVVSGTFIILQWIYIMISSEYISSLIDLDIYSSMNITITPKQIISVMNICGAIGIILSIITLAGGVFALQRKLLELVVVGGILGIIALAPLLIFIPNIISLIGVIIVIISRKEFQRIAR